MNKTKRSLLLAVISAAFMQCQNPNITDLTDTSQPTETNLIASVNPNAFHGKSKKTSLDSHSGASVSILETAELPRFSKELVKGLNNQLKVLRYQKKEQLRNSGIVDPMLRKLEMTVHLLLTQRNDYNPDLSSILEATPIKSDEGSGSTYFTGYFTPVMEVSKVPTAEYKYPIYARPENWPGKLPTRRQIDGEKILKGRGLEIAYAKNLLDIYFMQIQGSGIVHYPDGTNQILAFAGTNGHKYRSVGNYMIEKGYATDQNVSLTRIKKFFKENPDMIDPLLFENESYVFFSPVKYQETPKGAGHVPLTTEYSIAVDPAYIPLGSCLLAKVPIIGKNNEIKHYDYRILIAQDVGGAIKGPDRADLYTGVGEEGRRKASALHHYGNMWLLTPKQKETDQRQKVTASL